MGLFADALPTLLLLYPLREAFREQHAWAKLGNFFTYMVDIGGPAPWGWMGLIIAWIRIRARVRRRLSPERRAEIIPTLRTPADEIFAAIGRPILSILIPALTILPLIAAIRCTHQGRHELPQDRWGSALIDISFAAFMAGMILSAGFRLAALACLDRQSARWHGGIHALAWNAACCLVAAGINIFRGEEMWVSLFAGMVLAHAAVFAAPSLPLQWLQAQLAYPILEPSSGGAMKLLTASRPDQIKALRRWRWIARSRWLIAASAVLVVFAANSAFKLGIYSLLDPLHGAMRARMEGNLAEANSQLAMAEKWMPRNPMVYSMRGRLQFDEENYAAAAASFRRAIALKPLEGGQWGSRTDYKWLLNSFSMLGDHAALESAATEALAAAAAAGEEWSNASSYRADFLARRAEARAGLGRMAEAKADIEKALKLDPKNEVELVAEIKGKIESASGGGS